MDTRPSPAPAASWKTLGLSWDWGGVRQFRAQVAPLNVPTNRSKDTNLRAVRCVSTSVNTEDPPRLL